MPSRGCPTTTPRSWFVARELLRSRPAAARASSEPRPGAEPARARGAGSPEPSAGGRSRVGQQSALASDPAPICQNARTARPPGRDPRGSSQMSTLVHRIRPKRAFASDRRAGRVADPAGLGGRRLRGVGSDPGAIQPRDPVSHGSGASGLEKTVVSGLPFTGLDLIALLGVAVLLTTMGLALRRLTVDRDSRHLSDGAASSPAPPDLDFGVKVRFVAWRREPDRHLESRWTSDPNPRRARTRPSGLRRGLRAVEPQRDRADPGDDRRRRALGDRDRRIGRPAGQARLGDPDRVGGADLLARGDQGRDPAAAQPRSTRRGQAGAGAGDGRRPMPGTMRRRTASRPGRGCWRRRCRWPAAAERRSRTGSATSFTSSSPSRCWTGSSASGSSPVRPAGAGEPRPAGSARRRTAFSVVSRRFPTQPETR